MTRKSKKPSNSIKLFEGRKIRATWDTDREEWFFSIEDVVAVLTDSKDPKQYVKKMKQRDEELRKGWVHFVTTLTNRNNLTHEWDKRGANRSR